MLILIKGPVGAGKSTLAGRLVSHLDLDPVRWPVSEEKLALCQSYMGEWIDVSAYLDDCRHVDLERVLTALQITRLEEFPVPPKWSPGAPIGDMLEWRTQVFSEIYSGRFLPELYELTCSIIDALPHAVVEGEILGTSLQDSALTRRLRGRYAAVPTLRLQARCQPAGEPGAAPSYLALVNGRLLSHDDVVAALSRRPDGGIAVAPELGLSWSGQNTDFPIPPAEMPGETTPAGR